MYGLSNLDAVFAVQLLVDVADKEDAAAADQDLVNVGRDMIISV